MMLAQRTRVQNIADSAAINFTRNVMTSLQSCGTTNACVNSAISAAKAANLAYWTGLKTQDGTLSASNLADASTASYDSKTGAVTTTINLTFTYPTTFMGILGIPSVDLGVKSVSSQSMPKYIQVIFVVDSSGSMTIGGTETDIQKLQQNGAIQCAFACHDPDHYHGPTDYRVVARAAGIQLKIDYVVAAIQGFMTQLTPYMQQNPAFYSVGIDTIGTTFKVTQAPSTDLTTVQAATAAVDVDVVGPVSMNYGWSYITTGLKSALANITNVGDGSGSSASNRMTYLILLTDGIEDVPGSIIYGRTSDTSYGSVCTQIRNAGINLMTVLAPYPLISGDPQYTLLVQPNLAAVQTTMQNCASQQSWFYQAADGPGIKAAVADAFGAIFGNSPRLSQ